MKSTQLWSINGKTYNHAQLIELKRQGLDPSKDNIQMKFVTPQVIESERLAKEAIAEPEEVVEVATLEPEEVPSAEPEVSSEPVGEPETDEEEYERLKNEKAWVNNDKKARYNELKEKFKAV